MENKEKMVDVQVDGKKFLEDAQRVQNFLQHVEGHHPAYGLALLQFILEQNKENFKINKVDVIKPEPQSPILGVRKN